MLPGSCVKIAIVYSYIYAVGIYILLQFDVSDIFQDKMYSIYSILYNPFVNLLCVKCLRLYDTAVLSGFSSNWIPTKAILTRWVATGERRMLRKVDIT